MLVAGKDVAYTTSRRKMCLDNTLAYIYESQGDVLVSGKDDALHTLLH